MPASAFAALLLIAASRAPAPHAPSPRELGPFLLGQYESNVTERLGKPVSEEKGEEDARTLLYRLAEDTDLSLAVTVKGEEYPKIVALRLTGNPKPGFGGFEGFGNIKLGAARAEVVKSFGEPDGASKTEDGDELLRYDDRAYAFTLRAGKLRSIEIGDSEGGFPKKEESRPDLVGFQRALEARDKEAMLGYLCADFQIYAKDDSGEFTTIEFEKGAREELGNEESLVARYLYGGEGSVRDRLTPTLAKTPVTERDGWESGPHPVNAIASEGPLYEVVWNFEAGRWRVWEISLVPDEEERYFR